MKLLTFVLVFLFLTHPATVTARSEEATIRETTSAVLDQLNQNRTRLINQPIYIQQLVKELIVPHFDFRLMSQLVMGNYWQTFNVSEQSCFIAGFRNLLVERYAYILLSYDEQNITYERTEEIGEKGIRLVRQAISRDGAKPLPIEYAMEQKDEEWKVVDLIIDGVSLVKNHRGMFQSRIHTQGRDYFIKSFPACSN